MGSHPANLAFRFILEIAMFLSMGLWGWHQGNGLTRYVFALGVPLIAAVLWGTFNVPDDPSRSGKAPVRVPGFVRLLLELGLFGFSVWALYDLEYALFSVILGILVLVHYTLSYDRVGWLIRQ